MPKHLLRNFFFLIILSGVISLAINYSNQAKNTPSTPKRVTTNIPSEFLDDTSVSFSPVEITNPDTSETVNIKFQPVKPQMGLQSPSFSTFAATDVDSDGLKERIYYVPTAMNHGTAQIWIVKNDKTIFQSREAANRWFIPTPSNNGFYLLEGLQDDAGNWNAGGRKTRYIFREGKFVPIWYQDSYQVLSR